MTTCSAIVMPEDDATSAHEPFTLEQIARRMRLFMIIDQLCAEWFPRRSLRRRI